VAFDIFLKLEGGRGGPLLGDSVSDKHKSEIDVHSFSWGESHDGTTADPHELAFVTPISSASPQIAKYCAEGTQITSATISINTSSLKVANELLMIKLLDVSIGSYQLGIADTDADLADRFTLAFRSMDITKRVQRADGGIGTVTQVNISFQPPTA
jgi:type VI protein secretion system component Hcp